MYITSMSAEEQFAMADGMDVDWDDKLALQMRDEQ